MDYCADPGVGSPARRDPRGILPVLRVGKKSSTLRGNEKVIGSRPMPGRWSNTTAPLREGSSYPAQG